MSAPADPAMTAVDFVAWAISAGMTPGRAWKAIMRKRRKGASWSDVMILVRDRQRDLNEDSVLMVLPVETRMEIEHLMATGFSRRASMAAIAHKKGLLPALEVAA